MRRHGPVIAHCTDSEDFPFFRTAVIADRTFIVREKRFPIFFAPVSDLDHGIKALKSIFD